MDVGLPDCLFWSSLDKPALKAAKGKAAGINMLLLRLFGARKIEIQEKLLYVMVLLALAVAAGGQVRPR